MSADGQRYLVVGASGFLGSRLYAALGPERAIATYWRNPIPGGVRFDATTMRLRETVLMGKDRFTHAFLLGGITNIDACARDPVSTGKVNVDGYLRMIEDLLAAGVVPIFASSDAVYHGRPGVKSEDDERNPILTYGKQKLAVENHLLSAGGTWLVARLSKVVGTRRDDGTLVDQWLSAIESGEEILCARDQVFSPVDVDDVITALMRATEERLSGTYNFCGPRPLARLEFLQILIEKASKVRNIEARIVACSLRDLALAELRPLDTSISSARLSKALRMSFQDMAVVCERAVRLRYEDRGKASL